MTLFMDDGQVALHHGHVLDVLRGLPAESVQCVVTSPPYWALRAYGTEPQVWGGDAESASPTMYQCEDCQITRHIDELTSGCPQCGETMVPLVHAHEWGEPIAAPKPGQVPQTKWANVTAVSDGQKATMGAHCPCGAWRGELGHEPTPQLFVQHLVEVFREVKRVLKPDGVCFVNLGDSYAGSGKGPTGHNGIGNQEQRQGFLGGRGANSVLGSKGHRDSQQRSPTPNGTRPKSLVLIPERFALAMADDGWIVRSRIAWCKRAPMPESVRDRPTSAWEHVWLFSKSPTYFYDADAVREPYNPESVGRYKYALDGTAPTSRQPDGDIERRKRENGVRDPNPLGRNLRNFWLLSPDPEPAAHFATYPKELVRRCIAAGTSERGECPQCGKPWVRVVERSTRFEGGSGRAGNTPNGKYAGTEQAESGTYDIRKGPVVESLTTGWRPQCDHDLPPVPNTVLDPFVGSGTTTLVARSMLRRSIGIDLSEQYLRDIALRKNAQMALMPGEASA